MKVNSKIKVALSMITMHCHSSLKRQPGSRPFDCASTSKLAKAAFPQWATTILDRSALLVHGLARKAATAMLGAFIIIRYVTQDKRTLHNMLPRSRYPICSTRIALCAVVATYGL